MPAMGATNAATAFHEVVSWGFATDNSSSAAPGIILQHRLPVKSWRCALQQDVCGYSEGEAGIF
jgi:hypothetical protein